MKRNFIKKRMKASLTIEASFVITMTILVMGIILSLWIYKFQICWYTQSINECLLTGSNNAVLDKETYIDVIKKKWKDVEEQNYLVPQDLTVQIEGDKEEISITLNGSTPMWGYSPLGIEVKQKTSIVKPVKYIRKIAAVKGIVRE